MKKFIKKNLKEVTQDVKFSHYNDLTIFFDFENSLNVIFKICIQKQIIYLIKYV